MNELVMGMFFGFFITIATYIITQEMEKRREKK